MILTFCEGIDILDHIINFQDETSIIYTLIVVGISIILEILLSYYSISYQLKRNWRFIYKAKPLKDNKLINKKQVINIDETSLIDVDSINDLNNVSRNQLY